jgi:nicotinamidase-related amidase
MTAPILESRPADAVSEHTCGFELDARTTALIVIDMQYASASRTAGFGRWLDERGRSAEGAYRFDRIERLLVPNIGRLLAFFRRHDLPRVFIRLAAQMERCRDLGPRLRSLEVAFGNFGESRECDLLDELAALPSEPILTKLSASAFSSTGIDALLRNLDVRSIICTGVSTSQCVDLTARDAADRGYDVVIVEDAVAEDRADFHAWTLEQFTRLFGRVEATDTVIAELSGALARRKPGVGSEVQSA